MADTTKIDMGFCGWLAILFIGLKLTGFIGWSWWWVMAPLWIPVALVVLVVTFACLLIAVFTR